MAGDPNNPTYPGVYIAEVPSTVRTIAGVPTSVTAFVGRALSGPADDPVTLYSFADFERQFGGLWRESLLGYAVRDYFQNGGGQAIVVRVFNPDTTASAADGIHLVGAGLAKELVLAAVSPGAWANVYGFAVEVPTEVDDDVLAALGSGVTAADVFHVKIGTWSVVDGDIEIATAEQHLNVTVIESSRRVDRVLENASRIFRVHTLPAGVPSEAVGPGDDPLTATPEATWIEGNDGVVLSTGVVLGSQAAKTGLYALENADTFNLLYIPPYLGGTEPSDVGGDVVTAAATYCHDRRAVLLLDAPYAWDDAADPLDSTVDVDDLRALVGSARDHTAVYFPWLTRSDILRGGQLRSFPPGGTVAGVIARTDATRGVWKAPAGLEASLTGVTALTVPLTDGENGSLNPKAVNCLRTMSSAGHVVWGARTLAGDDNLASQWKYLPVRRLALHIEESLFRGTQWVVFEPNDEPLWAQIRLNVGAFMHGLFRKGAFQGQTPRDAYLVRCDKDTTTQDDINRGIVNILVGFAPLKPAEFVIVRIQQLAGQMEV